MSTSSIPAQVAAAALSAGVDPTLALGVASKESSFNPSAVNKSSGAAGVMQLMPGTAAGLGVTNSLDPAQNIPAGVNYLGQQLTAFNGDEASALAAYNWGPGNVSKAQAQYGADWLSHAPAETQDYVASILGSTSAAGPVTVSDDSDNGDDGSDGGSSAWGILALTAAGLAALWLANS